MRNLEARGKTQDKGNVSKAYCELPAQEFVGVLYAYFLKLLHLYFIE